MPRSAPPKGHILYELGELIARHRRARGLSQADLAMLIGVGATSVQYYEAGRYCPPLDTLVRIAHQCDLSLSAFLSPLDSVSVPDRDVRARA